MPRGDRTGPMGMGPGTGRGAGYCGGYGMPGYANMAFGRGGGMNFGRGRGFGGRGGGRGRGWRNMFYATGLPGWMRYGWNRASFEGPEVLQKSGSESEKQVLLDYAENLESELNQIKKRLSEFESSGDKESASE